MHAFLNEREGERERDLEISLQLSLQLVVLLLQLLISGVATAQINWGKRRRYNIN